MREIPLTKGLIAVVDDQDYNLVSQFKWCAHKWGKSFCAAKRKKHKNDEYLLHRLIMKPPAGFVIDHIDGNGLNNQRSNLRICTHAENLRNAGKYCTNRSGFKGVSWNPCHNKWAAAIRYYKQIAIGYFHDPKDAARAYDAAAIELHREFAVTNKSLGLL